MPTTITTARFGIVYPDPATRSASADVPRDLAAIATVLDASGAMYGESVHASRPAFGKHGRFWWETDTQQMFYDTGSAWFNMTPVLAPGAASIVLSMMAANSVDSSKIVDGTIVAGDIADGTITAAKLVNGIVPSRGASGATEALRALGTAAGTAAAGNDSRLVTTTRSLISGGPPGSPADGDVWIAVDSIANPTYQWNFRYNALSSSTYKWEANGCTPVFLSGAPASFAIPRDGDYIAEGKATWGNGGTSSSGTQTVTLESPAATAIDTTVFDAASSGWGGSSRQRVSAPVQGKKTGAATGSVIRVTGGDSNTMIVQPVRVI